MSDTPEIHNALEEMVVSPALIQELFDKDPLDLTNEDLDIIIAKFRSDRMNYLQPSEPKTKKVAGSKKALPAPQLDIDIDLGDLGL